MTPEIQAIFCTSGVLLAWLFGSRSRECGDADSDIDVAVLLRDDVSPIERLEAGGSLARQLSRAFEKPVDLIVLNDCGSLLRYEATARGRLVFGDISAGFAVERRARAAYEDLRHIQGFFTAAMRERLGIAG